MSRIEEVRICPVCGGAYIGYPSVSRVDGKTEICPVCGAREALAAAGFREGTELWDKAIETAASTVHKVGRAVMAK